MIRSCMLHGKELVTDPSLDDLRRGINEPDTIIWLDIHEELADDYYPLLQDDFKFHPLSIEHALKDTHVPKADNWGDYIYIVLKCFDMSPGISLPDDSHELDLFLGNRYLVTYHTEPITGTDKLWKQIHQDPQILKRGPSRLLCRLMDTLIEDWIPCLEHLNEIVDRIEEQIFNRPQDDLLEDIFAVKQQLLTFRRTLAPQREVFYRLARGDDSIIPERDRVYFRDIYDHLARIYDELEGFRDQLSNALDTYLSVMSNQMNDVMKTLTVITTLFMPLGFLTGFFGMNFFHPTVVLEGWTGTVPFIITLACVILIPVLLYSWVNRRFPN